MKRASERANERSAFIEVLLAAQVSSLYEMKRASERANKRSALIEILLVARVNSLYGAPEHEIFTELNKNAI